jgi:hypothetical protein
METLFSIANTGVLPFWILLVVAPRWRWTHVLCSLAVPLALGSLYLWLVSAGLGDGDFNSLGGVMKLFQNPRMVLAGWVHYLAFDLFIGAWETRDAMKHSVPRWLLFPCQFLTLMFGPVGLMLYLLLRGTMRKQWEPGV